MNTHDASAERATAFSTPHRAGGHSLFLFFALAYTFSWLVEIPLALRAQGLLGVPVPFELHYLAAYGPLLSAVVVTWREDGAEGLKELTGRMLKWRVRAWWWPVATLGAVAPAPVLLQL